MATISVSSGSYIRPYRHCAIRHFPEAASQTFVRGELLILDTDSNKGHQVKISGADPTAGIVGIAAESASGTENTMIPVWIANDENEFVAHVEDAMALDYDFVGDDYGVVKDTTNVIWRVDTTETTATVFKIVALKDAAADVNGRVIVRFLNTPRGVFKS